MAHPASWRERLIPMVRPGSIAPRKIVAGIAGTTGVGGLGVTSFALYRAASTHHVPVGIWVAAVALVASTAIVTCLGLVLDYLLKRLQAREATELQKTRLDMIQTVLQKAASEPASAQDYAQLLDAAARLFSVEQNGAQLADRTHAELYRPGPRLPGEQAEPKLCSGPGRRRPSPRVEAHGHNVITRGLPWPRVPQ